jgi:hypothetical protein
MDFKRVGEMINVEVNELYSIVSKASFFDFLKKIDGDISLDSRDEDPFDIQWMMEFNRIEKEKFTDKDIDCIKKIREVVFKASFKVIGNPEISGRISDDFELISKSIILKEKNSWAVDDLWKSYQSGIFPS